MHTDDNDKERQIRNKQNKTNNITITIVNKTCTHTNDDMHENKSETNTKQTKQILVNSSKERYHTRTNDYDRDKQIRKQSKTTKQS